MSWWMRLLLIGALAAVLAAGASAIRSHYISQGDAQGAARVKAAWDAQVRVDQAESLRLQQQANADQLHKFRNAERISHEDTQRALVRIRRQRDADAVVDSLQHTIDALNRRDLSTARSYPRLIGITQEAATARELLGSCSEAHSELAEAADQLRDQVTGLLDFVDSTCPRK